MAIDITFNGVEYSVPEFRDTDYANELTQFFVAIPNGVLQPTGGTFTLLAEVDFGGSYGLKSLYYKSRTANPASAGQIRLAKSDGINFRNENNDGDISISKDSSDNLQWNSTKILLSGAVVNADINASAAIAYSKLDLTGSIVNADINVSAAIAVSKLAALTASRAVVSDGSGILSPSATTSTEIGYLSGVTSAVQTQLDAKVNDTGDTMTGALGIGGAADASSLLTVTSTSKGILFPRMTTAQRDLISSPADGLMIYNTSTNQMNVRAGAAWAAVAASGGGTVNAGTQYQLAYYAANGTAVSGLTAITAAKALVSDANGLPVASTVTTTELQAIHNLTASKALASDGSGLISASTTTITELQAIHSLTADRALVSDGSGLISVSTATSTEVGYLSGVSSGIQSQLNGKEPTIVVLPIAKGGTNSGTSLNNNRVIQSSGGAIVEAAAITAARALISDANGIPTHSSVTDTELGYLSGVSSAIQTQLNGKASTALSNLASVAINTSLVSDSDSTDDLGSTTIYWRNAYVDNVVTPSINSTGVWGHRNRIINGDMRIDQRNAGASITYDGYAVDRFAGEESSDATATGQRLSATPPTGFTHYNRVTCTVADGTIGAAQYFLVGQKVEGSMIKDFLLGSASAKQFTLSFWVRSSLTGTYCVAFVNGAANRSYIAEYSISVADTWEKKTITLTGDVTGTWVTTNATGIKVQWVLAAGTNFQTSANTWTAGDLLSTSNQVNFLSSNSSRTWDLTGVQLEIGSTATDFEFRPDATELSLCQRYFWKTFDLDVAVAQNSGSRNGGISYQVQVAGTTAGYAVNVPFSVPMRSAPTITFYSSETSGTTWYNTSDLGNSGASNSTTIGQRSFLARNAQVAGDGVGEVILVHASALAEL